MDSKNTKKMKASVRIDPESLKMLIVRRLREDRGKGKLRDGSRCELECQRRRQAARAR